MSNFGKDAKAICSRLLQLDNNIIGLLICAIATYNWLAFYDGVRQLIPLYSQGFYGLLVLSAASASISAIYLTLAGIILLCLRRPISRYQKLAPNLVAILAVFTAYIFLWMPHGIVLHVNVYIPLFLIVSGGMITLSSLLFLRQAFSVTPQARFLVTAGPYSIVRHPMYVGNILALLGLALLINSPEALGLFLICGSLQVWRATYEEQLLEANFNEYAKYRSRVGCFVPRLSSRREVASARRLARA